MKHKLCFKASIKSWSQYVRMVNKIIRFSRRSGKWTSVGKHAAVFGECAVLGI